jgi:hypothetical protein
VGLGGAGVGRVSWLLSLDVRGRAGKGKCCLLLPVAVVVSPCCCRCPTPPILLALRAPGIARPRTWCVALGRCACVCARQRVRACESLWVLVCSYGFGCVCVSEFARVELKDAVAGVPVLTLRRSLASQSFGPIACVHGRHASMHLFSVLALATNSSACECRSVGCAFLRRCRLKLRRRRGTCASTALHVASQHIVWLLFGRVFVCGILINREERCIASASA